jgi:hypothetical protein
VIGADSTVIAARYETTAGIKDIAKRIPTVGADLQYAAIKAQVGIYIRRFKVKVVLEC